MKTLAIESTNPNITDMERAFLDTHFQDHISSMDMLVGVLEYNFISPLAGDGFGGSTILSTLYDGGTFTPWVAELLLIPVDTYSLFLGDWLDVSTWFTAETAIVNIDLALETLAAHTAYLEEPAAEFNCVFP